MREVFAVSFTSVFPDVLFEVVLLLKMQFSRFFIPKIGPKNSQNLSINFNNLFER